jgi:hypothetical protein
MKRLPYFFLFAFMSVMLSPAPIQAQTFQEYIALFPLINGATTWTDTQIAALPTSDKPTMDSKFNAFIGGTGYTFDIQKVYPLGKVEVGNTVIVFIAATSTGYNPATNTQIAVNSYAYNKKTGKSVGVFQSYVFSVGGAPDNLAFMYTGKMETDGKSWLKVYQTGSGSALTYQKAYKLTNKGLTYDKEF